MNTAKMQHKCLVASHLPREGLREAGSDKFAEMYSKRHLFHKKNTDININLLKEKHFINQDKQKIINTKIHIIMLAQTYTGDGPFHDVLSRRSSGQDWRG